MRPLARVLYARGLALVTAPQHTVGYTHHIPYNISLTASTSTSPWGGWSALWRRPVHTVPPSCLSASVQPILRFQDEAKPTVAVVGRPNVGKSALFNRLVGRREALMHNTPDDHVTRDVRQGMANTRPFRQDSNGVVFKVLDTPGLEPSMGKDTIQGRAMKLTEQLIQQSSVVVFLIDGLHGTHPDDETIAKWLRRTSKVPVLVVSNKCENYGRGDIPGPEDGARLGLGMPIPISSEANIGIRDLLSTLETPLREWTAPESAALSDDEDDEDLGKIVGGMNSDDEEPEEDQKPMQLVIVGRPNVGKSTLVNQLCGEERVLTGPERGLTRDSIRLAMQYQGKDVWLVDTAGWERRTLLEQKGLLASLGSLEAKRSMNRAHVVALLLDMETYLQQGRMLRAEVALARRCVQEGKALAIILNKADLLGRFPKMTWADVRQKLQTEVEEWFPQLGRIPCLAVSAQTGEGLAALMPECVNLYDKWRTRISTGRLNRWLTKVAIRSPHSGLSRVRFITQVKTRPPRFVTMLRGRGEFTDVDARTVMNALREDFGFDGVPLRVLQRRQLWEDHVQNRLDGTQKRKREARRAAAGYVAGAGKAGGGGERKERRARPKTSAPLMSEAARRQRERQRVHKHRKSLARPFSKANYVPEPL